MSLSRAPIGPRDLKSVEIDMSRPTPLFRDGGHEIYWLGITQETAFRCNAYLVRDGTQALIVDAGNRVFFPQVRSRVEQIMDPASISGLIFCHQDPDVAASICEWLEQAPGARVYTTPRTQVLLPHYGCDHYEYVDVTAAPEVALPSGAVLRFIEAPFLHFPGAFVTHDESARYLFSGDIWAALDTEWTLTVKDFERHRGMMDLFHLDYMASNIATRGFVRKLDGLDIHAILPQHGSIITLPDVGAALEYLREMRCGTDLDYPDLSP